MADSTGNRRGKTFERYAGLAALVLLVLAWYAGGLRTQSNIMPALQKMLPKARNFQVLGDATYAAWANKNGTGLLGYVKIDQAMGYGGPISVAVAVDQKGELIGLKVLEHKDTPTYIARVMQSGLVKSLLGKTYENEMLLGRDIDTISGATKSSNAIVTSARQAIRSVAAQRLGFKVPAEKNRGVSFGYAEIILLVLFALGILARRKRFKYTNIVRWMTMLSGLIFLGFIYNSPLTISMINQLLLGFWPDWHSSLYLYILLGGILIIFLVEGKNPYCRWICPFGSVQECLGKVTNAKSRSAGNYAKFLKWLHRGIALTAVLLALYFRDPGLTSYEVFGSLFQLWGSAYQFVIIALVLFMSLYTLRPWCRYLCPLRPVDDYFRMMRKWAKELWQTKKT